MGRFTHQIPAEVSVPKTSQSYDLLTWFYSRKEDVFPEENLRDLIEIVKEGYKN